MINRLRIEYKVVIIYGENTCLIKMKNSISTAALSTVIIPMRKLVKRKHNNSEAAAKAKYSANKP